MVQKYENLPKGTINYQDYENMRKQKYEKRKKIFILATSIVVFCILASIILFILYPMDKGMMLLFATIVPYLLYLSHFLTERRKIRIKLKEAIAANIIKTIDPSLSYSSGNFELGKGDYWLASYLHLSGFVPELAGYEADDSCRGEMFGFEFGLGDVNASAYRAFMPGERASDKSVSVYYGVFAFLKTSNKYPFTSIVPDGMGIRDKIRQKLNMYRKEQVKMVINEDADFEKQYDVWTNDKIATRKMLNSDFREYLKTLPKETNIGWRDEFIFFGVDKVNLFDFKPKEEITEDMIRKFYNDFVFYYNTFKNIASFVLTGSATENYQ